nr:hypothetical protein BaRGS_021912 [Batillaria attramentaria]
MLMLRRNQRATRVGLVFLVIFVFFVFVVGNGEFLLSLVGLKICNLRLLASQLAFRDTRKGHFDTRVADDLAKKVKVLCFITTMPSYVERALAVNATWAKRCTRYLFVTTQPLPDFAESEMHIVNVPEGRYHLTAKTFASLDHLYRHYVNDFDWFVKADDDVYIVMENLRLLLSHLSPDDPVYVGHHYQVNVHNGYMSGGASYVMSRQALKQLGSRGLPSTGGICRPQEPDEDVEVGKCLELVGVPPYRTVDTYGKESFHSESVQDTIFGPQGAPYDFHKKLAGIDCCSQLTTTFHYVSPEQMYSLEILLYRISVFGRRPDDDTLRKRESDNDNE